MEYTSNLTEPEAAVLVGVDLGSYDAEVSLAELEELAKTAGAQVVATMLQKRDRPDSATYIGSGRLKELETFCSENNVDIIIFDCELSPSQQRNIENETNTRVIDRTILILDIFAARAKSGEGKIQVELAQLKYSLTRLSGKGTALSRLGGGIGTRGPGETKLETDRRHIHRRIASLESELKEIEKRRLNLRTRRKKDGVETIAIVGYTNAGKSTLMNYLTDAGVLAENKLFATLDPTSRALTLPDGREVMMIDTVGLIRRLPHNLIESFKSTLEEATNASLILNVCDISDEHFSEHLDVTYKLLEELGCSDKPIISVMNKCDLTENLFPVPVHTGKFVEISALTGKGIPELLAEIQTSLPPTRKKAEFVIPYDDGNTAGKIRRDGIVLKEEFTEQGVYIKAVVDLYYIDKYKKYLKKL